MTAVCTSLTPTHVSSPTPNQASLGTNILYTALGNVTRRQFHEEETTITQTQAISQIKSMDPDELKSYLISLIESNNDNFCETSNSLSNKPNLPNRRQCDPIFSVSDSQIVQSPEWKIDQTHVKVLRRIGRGSCGTTYFGYWRGEEVAIKVAANTEMGHNGWETEMKVLQRLHHPNIIRFMGFIQNEGPTANCLVLEHCDAGTLSEAMENATPSNFFSRVVKSMANGMAYLHERKILHRDIKPDNVLLHGNLAGGRFTVKMSDFGLATIDKNESEEHTAETGTYRYMAPEIIRHLPYSFKADVYSFAIVTWQLLTREDPFSDKPSGIESAAMVALANARPMLPQGIPDSIAKLIQTCWEEDPNLRPSFDEVLVAFEKVEKDLNRAEVAWIQRSDGHPVYKTDETSRGDTTDECSTRKVSNKKMDKTKSHKSIRKSLVGMKGLFNSKKNKKK